MRAAGLWLRPFAERLAEVGVPLVPAGPPVRPLVHGAARPSPADLPRLAAEMMAVQFDTLAAAAEGCDVLVATGLLPAAASARSVTEKLGIRYVYAAYCPIFLPSPHHAPTPFPGRPFPPDVTDNRVLWDLQAQRANELFGPALNTRRASIGLPPVDNVYALRLHQPPLAGGGPDPRPVAGAGGSRRRANGRVDPAGRASTPGRVGGVPGRRHTTGVRGLRQYARPGRTSPGSPSRRSAPRAAARSLPAAGPTWP